MKPWMLWTGVGAVAAAAILASVLLMPDADSTEPEAEQETLSQRDHIELQAQLEELGLDVHTDSDGDGLPDVMENFIYGSDPQAFSTTGNGIPDGWFARYGYDPTAAGIEAESAATPPADTLPDVYNGYWPDKYRWTLSDVYRYGIDDGNESYHDNGIDPNAWAAPSGLPMAWLIHHEPMGDGWNVTDPDLADDGISGDGFTVRDNYQHDTDPRLADTDGDGLTDAQEVRTYRTDPRAYSSSGTGIPDGWLVLHRFDPTDQRVGTRDPAGKGMTVAEVWTYNVERFGEEEALDGAGLAPDVTSQRGDGVPDGWLVDHALDPLDAGIAELVLPCASEHDGVRHATVDDTPEGLEPIPDLCPTVADTYNYGRPPTWQEDSDGPWPGGLDPRSGDQDEDGLPDAVELRGWYVKRVVDTGPGARPEWIHVRPDPRKADTDSDGITDHEEYHGSLSREGNTYRFPPTDPTNPDTAFSGMTDAQKILGTYGDRTWGLHETLDDGTLRPLLDPTRRDTAADHLPDGGAMEFWSHASRNVLDGVPYTDVYPGSTHETYLTWINGLGWLVEEGRKLDEVQASELLAPDGDADGDGIPNAVDPSASGDGLLNGWQVAPTTLRFSDLPSGNPRTPTDPANPDTSGDGLPDWWKLRHGQWNSKLGGWDLDPTRSDSDGDGVPDHKENLDGDVVTWYAFSGGAQRNEWPFTNALELRAGTDPRVSDQNRDGVTEGWIYFWIRDYLDRLDAEPGSAKRDSLGDRAPDKGEVEATRPRIAEPDVDPMTGEQIPVGRRVKDEVRYYRFVEAPDSTLQESLLNPAHNEVFLEGFPRETTVLRDGEAVDVRIGIIEGVYQHTFAEDAQWGLNPYLLDTDGDGIRDAWKALYAPRCADGLDPASPSQHGDPDKDGLSNLDVYRRGIGTRPGDYSPDPCLADTDLDGLDDGTEVLMGLDPLNPEDAVTSGTAEDHDGDGLFDRDEIKQGTDPVDPDTDRDGLLDWLDLPRPGQELDPQVEADLQVLGIAHRQCPAPDGSPSVCFYGEASSGSDALDPDASGDGIPDGWFAYHLQGTVPTDPRSDLVDNHACGMPAWWQESLLGVWWWGIRPSATECPRDRDMDGLDDRNGEDPVPAASQSNRAAGIDLQDLLAEPPSDPLDLVRTAQAWGECAGNPRPCFDDWAANGEGLPERVPVRIDGLEVTGPGVDLPDLVLAKEEAFTVSGTLLVDVDDAPAPHRTVVLRLWPDQPGKRPLQYSIDSQNVLDGITLGVGFTDENGGFAVDGCLCAGGGTIAVPAGLTALGRSDSTAAWDPQAAMVPVGSQWTLGVHAYASAATFWGDDRADDTHPQYLEVDGATAATESLWHPWGDLHVASATAIAIGDGMPDQIAWGDDRVLPVTVQLRDASGGAVGGQDVTITVTGASSPLGETRTTDPEGRAEVEFNLGDRTGTWRVKASYGGDADIGLDAAGPATTTVTLQAPLTLAAPADEPNVRLGEPAEFTVTARSQGTPVEGLEVDASLGSTKKTAATDQDGVATFSITPTGMDPGAAQVTFSASSTDGYAAASVKQGISLVSGSLLQANPPDVGNLGAPLPMSGCLTLTDGTKLDGQTIDATLAGGTIGEPVTTNGEGCFSAAPIVPLDLGIGVHTLRLTYDGEPDAIDAATFEKSVRFSVGTRLSLNELHAGRGQDHSLSGRLTSITGHPLVGEELSVTLPWNETITVLARSGGYFTQSITIPADHALGVFQINASYAGSENGTFGASKTHALLEIGSPSRIEAQPLGVLHRGNNTVTGRLVDGETDEPIAGAVIHATPSVGDALTIQTDEEGRYRFSLSLARDIPGGDVDIVFRFDGDEGYAPAQNSSHGVLRVPAHLAISAPSELGRATSHSIDLLLTDDRGAPLAGRNVTLNALGTPHNATTGKDGTAAFTLDVPVDTELGATRLRAAFAGEEAHDGTQSARDAVIKDGVRVTIEGMPDEVRPGQRVTLTIHVEDTSGRPVETPVVVRIEGVPGSLLVETDENGRAEAPIVVPDAGGDALRVTVRFPGTDLLASRTEALEPRMGLASVGPTSEASQWSWMIAAASAVAVAAAGVVLIRRRRPTGTSILEEAGRRIASGDPWTDAVLDAYRRLARLVKDYGIVDDEGQTGRAFAQTLVTAGFLAEPAAVKLVSLFERARYNDGALHQQDAEAAQRVLRETAGSVQRIETHRGGAPA